MASVKWLMSIDAKREPFAGFQQAVAYRHQRDEDDPRLPFNRIRVRALMVQPGIPDFFTRRREVDRRRVELSGRAWSGNGSSERVEIGTDGTWTDATVGRPIGGFAWRPWSYAPSGRETDSAGAVHPTEQR